MRIGASFKNARATAEPLALPAGELGSALAEDSLVALRQPGDEIMGVGGLCGFDDFVHFGIEPAVKDVCGDGAREKEWLL